ncbi:prepilin-type N-terminal cleavage/methylation domain-containing protein [Luteibacter aegosomatissinici]|uniref:prepilin-type N-terminal cleavage/methylation domain-containing protein n=1 Tax=Luteibacter aegosomatissinici TaxID=2911539 RepID=UPI001FF93D3A|nr:prepilin-type N-terminal cleavage/methylation domain-containing protein [Luteibacter aegosomatissinici]UPG94929.1 prepilin-type N-terminal cleavage/methylation domain-containing protein [Luteibacter aegosomatissinici]
MKRSHGFSLMEVLAALALLSIVLLGVYSGISTAGRIVRSGDRAIERMDEVRSTQAYLRSELAQALVMPFGETDDGDPVVFAGASDKITFVAPMPGYLSRLGPQMQVVALVADGRDDYRLEVSLFLLPPDGSEPKALGDPQVLLRGIHKGTFSYRGMDEQNKPMDWQEKWADGRRTPSLVRIALDLDGTTAFPTMIAPLRIDPSASRNGFSLSRGSRGPVVR